MLELERRVIKAEKEILSHNKKLEKHETMVEANKFSLKAQAEVNSIVLKIY